MQNLRNLISILDYFLDFSDSCILLGDSAYPLRRYLLTPYRDNGHLTREQKLFNKTLSSCRVDIENTFGHLKQRFRQLYHLKLKDHIRLCHFIRACCVLHNLGHSADINIFNNEDPITDDQPDVEQPHFQLHAPYTIRDEICHQIYCLKN